MGRKINLENYNKLRKDVSEKYYYTLKLKNDLWITLIRELTLNEFKILFVILNRFCYQQQKEHFVNTTFCLNFDRQTLNQLLFKKYSITELYKIIDGISKKVGIIKLNTKGLSESWAIKTIEIELIEPLKIINSDVNYTILNSFQICQVEKKIELIVLFYLLRYKDKKELFFNEKTLIDEFKIKKPWNRYNLDLREYLKSYEKAYEIKEIKPVYNGKKIEKILVKK